MSEIKKLTLRLINLNCFATEEQGYDDVYIMLDGKKIWPEKKRQRPVHEGGTPLNVEIPNLEPGTSLDLEIWDYDLLSPDDLMGRVPVYIDKPGGPYTTDMIPNPGEAERAKYTVEWEIDFDS